VTISQRRDRLRRRLYAAELDAMLVTDLVNVRYLSGFTGSNAALLIHVDDDVPLLATDGRYVTQAARQAPDAEIVIERACAPHLTGRAREAKVHRLGFESHVVTVDGYAVLAQAASGWLKSLGPRSAFNPLEELKDQSLLAYGFLTVRFFGLVLVVPVIEEFFLRGCVMRYVVSERFWEVPFGNVNRAAVIAGTLIPVLMHPQEALAAAIWFSAVTWLMIRSRNIWDCVLAHAVTNLLMGIYVIASGQWWLM